MSSLPAMKDGSASPLKVQSLDGGSDGPTLSNIEIQVITSDEDLRPVTVDPKGPPPRGEFGSKLSYFLTLVGYAVGFGNIWRFPYQLRENGGLVFLIPYCIMLATLGIPIFFLELAVGQRRRKGVLFAWSEISPILGGIGVSCGCLCTIITLYYNTLLAYCLSYLVDSFKNPLPWTNCKTVSTDNSLRDECSAHLDGRSTKYYWFRHTLEISPDYQSPGDYNWTLCLYLMISWGAIYGILVRGMHSLGLVVYITALFPYVVLVIFFIANLCIEPEKGWLGAYRLVKPDWSRLYNPTTWLKAASQIFYSLSLAEGCLVVFASYSPARNNCHKDAVLISLINCATSVFAAVVVFPMIGLLGHRKYEQCFKDMSTYLPTSKMATDPDYAYKKYDIYFSTSATSWAEVSVDKPIRIGYHWGELLPEQLENWAANSFEFEETITTITKITSKMEKNFVRACSIGQEATASGGGTGFVFMGFTEAVKNMPGSNFWSALFFLMLITLGIDSALATVEGVVASAEDLTRKKRSILTSAVVGIMLSVALALFPFGWGLYILELLDQWVANWTYLLIALLECIAVSWDYGLAQFSYDVLLMTGSKPNVYMLICWKYISPILISLMLIGSIVQFIYETHQNGGFMYVAFQPGAKNAKEGDLELPIPPHVLTIGFLLMILCLAWVPLNAILHNTSWNMLRSQAPAHFPEEELREERKISVEREEDHFTDTEKAIMGLSSLVNLQKQRDTRVGSYTDLRGSQTSN